MKDRAYSVIAYALGILLAFVVLSSPISIVLETGHDCSGHDCQVCRYLESAEETLRGTSGAVLLTGILLFFSFLVSLLSSVGRWVSQNSNSLISMGVRLNS